MKARPLASRLWSMLDKSGGPGACWRFTGTGPRLIMSRPASPLAVFALSPWKLTIKEAHVRHHMGLECRRWLLRRGVSTSECRLYGDRAYPCTRTKYGRAPCTRASGRW